MNKGVNEQKKEKKRNLFMQKHKHLLLGGFVRNYFKLRLN